MLNLNAFESGMLFEQQLIEDESLLRYGPAPISGVATATRCRDSPVVFETPGGGPRALLRDNVVICKGEAPVIKAHHRPMMKRWLPATRKLWRVLIR